MNISLKKETEILIQQGINLIRLNMTKSEGECLDNLAKLFEIERKENESDEELRIRIKEKQSIKNITCTINL